MATSRIEIRGARQHNLKGVDLDLPRERLVVFCGPSGSGKSSLAFDTLFAEGQRRYVESLSSYARQFLGQMDKPRYDAIRGLTPTIAVAQGGASRNPRSTVGTLTEVHDYLRVLFARAGQQHCHRCGEPVASQSAAEVARAALALPEGTRALVLAPVLRQRKGAHAALLQGLLEDGFARVRVEGEVVRIEEAALDEDRRQDVEVVVDRVRLGPGAEDRVSEAVETALRVGGGVCVLAVDGEGDRVLSEHLACHACGLSFPDLAPQSFSFNSPVGMCPDCDGLGFRAEVDPARLVPDPGLSLHEGALELIAGPLTRRDGWNYAMVSGLAQALGFSLDAPWRDLPEGARQVLLFGADERVQVERDAARFSGTFAVEWEGIVPTVVRRLKETKSEGQRERYMAYLHDAACSTCGGTRLRPESGAVRVGPWTLPQLTAAPVAEARAALEALDLEGSQATIASELLAECAARLRFLEEVGLGYLALDRSAATLSGGESQRIRLAGQLGGELTGVTYVLDEPSIGLHPRDTRQLVGVLERLRDQGNTVVVVEHDRDTIQAADHVVDFGPGAGARGGEVVFTGAPEALAACTASLTGDYLAGRRAIPAPASRRSGSGRALTVVGARQNNLRGVDVDLPLGTLTVITGVSGAGKSSLVRDILSPALHNALHGASREVGAADGLRGLEHVDKVIDIDQSPIGRSPRSNPATYTKVYDAVRKVFAGTKDARVRGFAAGRFSFNSKGGRCEACRGDGYRKVEMHFLPDVYVPCEVCGGSRFDDTTLAVRFRGHSIADVLALTVSEALELFRNHRSIARILSTLEDVGLGYLPLGQPSTTLSGGEAQRIKLSRELGRPAKGHTIYILDEPTTGLHFEDVRRLLEVLHALVDQGHTVVVVEHDLDVVRSADHVIDLGPGGGDAGGRVVVAGPPEAVAACESSHTGRCLADVGARA